MKLRKLFAVCMALMIILGSVTTVNASESNVQAVDISEDSAVQAAYDAYFEISDALNVHEYGPLKDAVEKYTAITDAFTDEQSDEWDRVVADVIGYDEALSTLISANMVVDTVAKKDAYQADPNAKTAEDFVYMYEECVAAEIRIDLFEPGIESVYETAKTVDMPSEDVLKVYDAYVDLAEALEALEYGFYDEDFVNACKNFEAALDIFNELTEEELAELACLMEVENAEEAFSIILSDWINANLALELGAVYDAYQNDPTDEKAASEFVEKYEEILNDTQMLTDADKKVILTSFKEAYEMAKDFLAETDDTPDDGQTPDKSDKSDKSDTSDKSDKSVKTASPKTGDASNAAPFAALMVIAAAVAGLAVKRRKVQ